MMNKNEIFSLLIEKWSKDKKLQFGVPYRQMATEAAEIIEQYYNKEKHPAPIFNRPEPRR